MKVTSLCCRFILTAVLFFCFSLHGKSQSQAPGADPPMKYGVKLDPSVAYDVNEIKLFLKDICGASAVSYNNTTKFFEVTTVHRLEKNKIMNRLYKNGTPMLDYLEYGTSGPH